MQDRLTDSLPSRFRFPKVRGDSDKHSSERLHPIDHVSKITISTAEPHIQISSLVIVIPSLFQDARCATKDVWCKLTDVRCKV